MRFLYHVCCFLLLSSATAAGAAELKQDTIKAWEESVRAADSRMAERARTGNFLWVDEAADRQHRVRQGEVLVAALGEHSPKNVPHGLMHDWIGAAFIPRARISDVLEVVRDYARYKDFYGPAVIDSGRVSQTGAQEYKFSMVLLNQALFQKNALEGDYKSSYVRLNDRRWYSVTSTTRVQEIDDYGQAGEHKLPVDQGNGYIWRLYSLARFEERDGGVYVELEVMALSRDIPVSVRWVVEPIVRRVSRTSLMTSLRQTVAHVSRPVYTTSDLRNRSGAL
jgi:hypothetical protein